MILGLVAGALLAGSAADASILLVASPVGKLWLDALTMTVVPLVFSLLVTGVISAADSAAGGRAAPRALTLFVVLLPAVCLFSALLTPLALEVWPVPAGAVSLQLAGGESPVIASAADWLENIIPANPLKAAADTAMVPLVLFALLFGLAASRIEPELRASIQTFFRAIVQAMLKIVHWVLLVAPLGVFALAYAVGSRTGMGAAGTLLHYVAFVASACIITALLACVIAALAGRMSPLAFARAALPAQVVAASTQSSLASLPAMIEAAGPLQVDRQVAGVVLPLAVAIFRAASAAANVTVAVYLAQLHGMSLTAADLIAGAFVAAAVSIAAVGLPAQVSFFAIIGPVCLAMGVPIQLLPLLLAVETIPDIFRTIGDVTADLAVVRLVAGRPKAEAQPVRS
ncbi:dicarboxylate/amino acid:cation symporter [Croceibacterium ferulae]|uniref:dicarboxylate/amino acid:cation symporter n=1 Tax=Croceibacterium ferulae TaxID=1854641 RepID=UPI000EB27F08|nr:cation:dicarboxylase symporter family transporter [Croceibacterium ferulae]